MDYSHGIRPVRRWMRLDGVAQSCEQVVTDPERAGLLSDEGEVAVPRYDR